MQPLRAAQQHPSNLPPAGGGWQDPSPLPVSPAWTKLSCFLGCFYGRDGVKYQLIWQPVFLLLHSEAKQG